MKNAVTIAFSKRETADVYVFDILEISDINSFKIGCAVVNVKTEDFSSHGMYSPDGEFTRKCREAAKGMSRLFEV